MENVEQENSQKIQAITPAESGENASKINQFVPPQEAFDRAAELERQYRETVERENV